jgi:predicted dehydrogenase
MNELLTLPYQAPAPKSYQPEIGVIGCGGIAKHHLSTYSGAGFRVTALCDLSLEKAVAYRDRYFPQAAVFVDYRDLLSQTDVEVVDVTTHPAERVSIIETCLRAGRHVLSQKPFVLDIAEGKRLVDVAQEVGRLLAVNQNGRWAPHFSYLRHLVGQGHLGEVSTVDCSLQFDHNWTAGTPFDEVHHLILYDFAIHWFDMVGQLMAGQRPEHVTANVRTSRTQDSLPPLMAHAAIAYPNALATLSFNGDTRLGAWDRTVVVGSRATASSEGPDLNRQRVTVHLQTGAVQPRLEGAWFDDGFRGAMGELLCAIEEQRTPIHAAASNLESLELCFAALASADQGGVPVQPGAAKRVSARIASRR